MPSAPDTGGTPSIMAPRMDAVPQGLLTTDEGTYPGPLTSMGDTSFGEIPHPAEGAKLPRQPRNPLWPGRPRYGADRVCTPSTASQGPLPLARVYSSHNTQGTPPALVPGGCNTSHPQGRYHPSISGGELPTPTRDPGPAGEASSPDPRSFSLITPSKDSAHMQSQFPREKDPSH